MNLRTAILLFVMANIFPLIANAQVTEGNWLVGGDANFNHSNLKTERDNGYDNIQKGFNFTVQPKIGYFPIDKFAFGLNLRLNYNTTYGGGNSSWNYGVGPFVRYYFLPTDKLFNVFSEVNYLFSTDLKGPSYDSNSIGLQAGAVVFFTNSVGLEMVLNYDYLERDQSSLSFISNGFSLGIGFQVHLKKED